MQVGLAFRERRVDVSTLPQRMAAKVAEALKTSTETLLSYLALPRDGPYGSREEVDRQANSP
jgi:hypothetical protein